MYLSHARYFSHECCVVRCASRIEFDTQCAAPELSAKTGRRPATQKQQHQRSMT